MEIVKEGARNTAEPTRQQAHGIQSQFHSQHQNLLRLPQQVCNIHQYLCIVMHFPSFDLSAKLFLLVSGFLGWRN